jgi:3-oxoacyl-[acyl-carrier-protein] synthase-3
MSFLRSFGSYLPSRIVPNEELGAFVHSDAEWIRSVSGIEQRRFADQETVADMGVAAARNCLDRAGVDPSEIGMILVSSGTSERRFPGPAAAVAHRLGLDQTPAVDIPVASAGSLIALSIASKLVASYGNVLVVACEKLSPTLLQEPVERGVAVLFGDGAGACLLCRDQGGLRVLDSALHTDGAFADDLRLELDGPVVMNGRSVIMQASRKIPRVIEEVLERNNRKPAEVEVFLMHQANQNLINKVAAALSVPSGRFFSNIAKYGNTSSASMLIAAAEWANEFSLSPGRLACFAAFGAGFQWGSLLVEGAS